MNKKVGANNVSPNEIILDTSGGRIMSKTYRERKLKMINESKSRLESLVHYWDDERPDKNLKSLTSLLRDLQIDVLDYYEDIKLEVEE